MCATPVSSSQIPSDPGLAKADPHTEHTQLAPIVVRWRGNEAYQASFDAMREFTAARNAGTPDEIWLVEHPPVFTLGLAGRREHLLAPGHIAIVATDRGGQVLSLIHI